MRSCSAARSEAKAAPWASDSRPSTRSMRFLVCSCDWSDSRSASSRVRQLGAQRVQLLGLEPCAVERRLGLRQLAAELCGLSAGAVERLLCDQELVALLACLGTRALELCVRALQLGPQVLKGAGLVAELRELGLRLVEPRLQLAELLGLGARL